MVDGYESVSVVTRKRTRPTFSLKDALIKRNVLWKAQAQTTPWIDGHEFAAVGRSLVAAADTTTILAKEIHQALQKVAIWRARSQRLPHAVESSAALAQLLWREHCCNHSVSCTTTELRLAYASAVIRSINGLADALDQERAMATSVARRSNQLGIPSWLVEIRHRATHNELPTLAVLRMAATTLLHYFQAVYWGPLENRRHENENRAKSHLEEYREAHVHIYRQQASETCQRNERTAATSLDDGKATGGIAVVGHVSTSSEDENDDTDEDDILAFRGSKIGTSFNSFAALQEPKRKRKNKKEEIADNVLTQTGVEHPEAQSKKKRKKGSSTRAHKTPTECIKQFIKSNISIDIAYQSVLRFLVDSFDLDPDILDTDSHTSGGLKKLRQRHSPLLVAVTKEWPGFAARLLVGLFDTIMSLEGSMKGTSDVAELFVVTRKVFLLSSWTEYLLSDAFLGCLDVVFCKKKGVSHSNFAAMQALNYPIKTLHDRCLPPDDVETRDGSRIQCLREILKNVLDAVGNDGGVDGNGNEVESAEGVFQDADPSDDPSYAAIASIACESTPTRRDDHTHDLVGFDRSDMPAKESADVEGLNDTHLARATVTDAGPWQLCETWSPCSIGMFRLPDACQST